MCKCVFSLKPDIFTVFPINSQSKLKKNSAHHFWDAYQEKLATKFNKVSWRAVSWRPRNFHNRVFVKNYYLKVNFKYCSVLSLKTKKIFSEKMQAN